MTPGMSDRPADACFPDRKRGFTLLEMLVVLVLLAVLAGLAVPRLITMYEAAEWRLERDEALKNLATLSYMAYIAGAEFELVQFPGAGGDRLPLTLPPGWQLTARRPIHYFFNGVCTGGALQLTGRGRSMEVMLEPPLCRPVVL